ncbi:MAG: cytochrome c oxidase subunit II [Acidimicrobiales bacterium]
MAFAKVGAVNAQPPGTAAPRRRRHRLFALVAAVALPVVLGGCQVPTFWGYRGNTTQGRDEFNLYAGTFIAAIVVGALTGLLILWAVIRYRRRSDDMPRQFQYHIPLELTYTIVPILIVLVLFGFTAYDENKIDLVAANPAATVNVYGFQWGWEFDYAGTNVVVRADTVNDPDPVGPAGLGSSCTPAAWCRGPGLVVPAGQTVQINLRSKDVIHGFYVPAFNFSRYAQPGVLNQFDLDVKHSGVYRAQCTQFCGLYHSIMLFHVVAMPPAQYQAWLSYQQNAANSTANSPTPPYNQSTTPTTPSPGSNATNPNGGPSGQ